MFYPFYRLFPRFFARLLREPTKNIGKLYVFIGAPTRQRFLPETTREVDNRTWISSGKIIRRLEKKKTHQSKINNIARYARNLRKKKKNVNKSKTSNRILTSNVQCSNRLFPYKYDCPLNRTHKYNAP